MKPFARPADNSASASNGYSSPLPLSLFGGGENTQKSDQRRLKERSDAAQVVDHNGTGLVWRVVHLDPNLNREET